MIKGGVITDYERMKAEQQALEKQINSLKHQLQNLPEGKLLCARNENRYKWYQSDGKHHIYIPKKKRYFAEQLAIKKYLTLLLEEKQREKDVVDYYFQHCSKTSGQAERLLTEASEYRKLLLSHFKPISEELHMWMTSNYNKNPRYLEQLIHETSAGFCVRSKSEALITMILQANKIPFRYECELQLGDTIIYPDFTIRHPKTGKTYYWEHFGKMDDENYCRNACLKIQSYALQGIIPNIQLITTYETKGKPLSVSTIEKMVKDYFL